MANDWIRSPGISIGSDRSAKCATTTVKFLIFVSFESTKEIHDNFSVQLFLKKFYLLLATVGKRIP